MKKFVHLMAMVVVLILTFSTVYAETTSRVISKISTAKKVVALTFDCEDGTNERSILKVLSNYNVKATFFVTGKEVEAYPNIVRDIHRQGNEVVGHSYSHLSFVWMNDQEIINEVKKTDTLIKRITRQSTKPYIRPPYGAYDQRVLNTLASSGYSTMILWNIETYDWQGRSAEELESIVQSQIVPGSIILMHAISSASNTVTALPNIIQNLKNQGYTFLTIEQLLKY